MHFYIKELLKKTINNVVYSSAGYYWDNNYKSLIDYTGKEKYEYTKFSKAAFTKIDIKINNSFKINKLCRISIDKKNKNISIYPWLYKGKIKVNAQDCSIITVDNYSINFPLVWQQGFFEFKYLKLKWILKKNRFQFTLHSSENKRININNDSLDLIRSKKNVKYIDVSHHDPEIHISLFNNKGATKFSNHIQNDISILISGFAYTKFGTITNNILYTNNIRKHNLFAKDKICNDTTMIPVNIKIQKFRFYTKYASKSINIPYFNNDLIDRFVNLNSNNHQKLLVKIDYEFSDSLKIILTFFEKNFGFQPEYILFNKISKIQFRSNLLIEFIHNSSTGNLKEFHFDGKISLRLFGKKIDTLLMNLRNIIINSINNHIN